LTQYIIILFFILLALDTNAQRQGIAGNNRNIISFATDSIELIPVDGGTFQMGAIGNSYAEPVHTVTLSSFYISKYEITQAQWEAVMNYNDSKFTNCPRCPVEYISWLDVQNFIKELNRRTGKKNRLPTEAEWEFAARGGNYSSNHKYAGSDFVGDVAWYRSNSEMKTHPVGKKQPNELGLYDMLGNVDEWCSDWFGPDYYKTSETINPKGPPKGNIKIMRGGDVFSNGKTLETSERTNCPCDENFRAEGVGFRIVQERE
jgi:formylglycine-generating enzyme